MLVLVIEVNLFIVIKGSFMALLYCIQSSVLTWLGVLNYSEIDSKAELFKTRLN